MKKLVVIFGLVLIVAVCTGSGGCETKSASESDLSIAPPSARVRIGQSVEFTASGGYDYKWSLDEDKGGGVYGMLSTRTDNKTIYTSLREPGSNVVVRVLTVKSTIPGASGGTNAPAIEVAEAYITHL